MARKLTEWDLRVIAEVTLEMAKYRGTNFHAEAEALLFARAAQIDPNFRAQLAEALRRIEAHRGSKLPRRLLAPLAPLFRDLERDAEAVVSGSRQPR